MLDRTPRGCCRGAGPRRTPWRCARSGCPGPTRPAPRRSGPAGRGRRSRWCVKPSSTGGSNDTSPAQCTTASRSVGQRRYVGQVALDAPRPAPPSAPRRRRPPRRPRRRSASRAAWRSGPRRWSSPWAGPAPSSARPGTSLSIRCSSASPTKPVTPVSRTCWPASRSATDPSASRLRSCHVPRTCDERGARPPASTPGGSAASLLDLLLDEQEQAGSSTPSSDTSQTMTVAAIHVPAPSIERPLETSEVMIRPTRVATRATPPRKRRRRAHGHLGEERLGDRVDDGEDDDGHDERRRLRSSRRRGPMRR